MTTPRARDGRDRRSRRRFAATLLVLLVVMTIVLLVRPDAVPHPAPPRTPIESADRPPGPPFRRGVYGTAVRYPDPVTGIPRLDATATIAFLQAVDADLYAYLICPDPTGNPAVTQQQWEDLPRLAELAGEAGIAVYVYLVPPTEAPQRSYAPYFWNYTAWAEAVGRLAATHPALRGLMIDDFGGNTKVRPGIAFHFTPDYVLQMLDLGRRKAAWFSLYPVLYYHDIAGEAAVLSKFRSVVSGIVFPYIGTSVGHRVPGNTRDASRAFAHGAVVGELLSCAAGRDCTAITFPAGSPSAPATVTRTVRSVGGVPRSVVLRALDDLGSENRGSRFRVEVLVDGRVVGSLWTSSTWRTARVPIHADLVRSSVDIGLRVYPPASTGRGSRTLILEHPELVGFAPTHGVRPEELHGPPGLDVAQVRDLPVIFMTYAVPLSAERGRGAAPRYVQSVLSQVESLRERRLADGSLIFNLPISGPDGQRPDNYRIVQEMYRRWK